MKIRFISDLHYGHTNINEKHDKRGFATTLEMDEYMIKQWNSVVAKDDEVYVLGDFSFYGGKETNEIIKRLNGKIFLIEGNHDKAFYVDEKSWLHFLEFIYILVQRYIKNVF
jgi:calcineurin-like phosphoesterase family protein